MQTNFQLTAEPNNEVGAHFSRVRFVGYLEAEVAVKLTNKTKDRKAFKVKCTRNDMFRIRPPVGTLDPDESTIVTIHYKYDGKEVPQGKRHHFAIYHIAASKGVGARAAWSAHKGQADGVLRMWAFFENAPGGNKEDEAAKDGNTPPHLMSDIKKPDEPKPNSKHDSKPDAKPSPEHENPDGPKKPAEAVQRQQTPKDEQEKGPQKPVIKAPANATRVDPHAEQYKTIAELDKVSFTADKKFKSGDLKAPEQPTAADKKEAEYEPLANLDENQVFEPKKKDK
ncbi:MSP-domain protein 2 [Aphelenchoides avenae]|nr:MSP-domain protein 2 [Aphelenchus avenae]